MTKDYLPLTNKRLTKYGKDKAYYHQLLVPLSEVKCIKVDAKKEHQITMMIKERGRCFTRILGVYHIIFRKISEIYRLFKTKMKIENEKCDKWMQKMN